MAKTSTILRVDLAKIRSEGLAPSAPVGAKTISMMMFRNVRNAAQMRSDILKRGSILENTGQQVAMIKAEMICDPLQVATAAQKAECGLLREKLTTRTWSTEVIFNLSGSKNITDSLIKFGIGDADTELIAVIRDTNEDLEQKVIDAVQGELVPLAQLEAVTDWSKIEKAHKLANAKSNDVSTKLIKSLLISRAGAKEIAL